MRGTGIGWAHDTWNPWIGCNEVSPECDGCYARTIVEKKGQDFNSLHPSQTWRDPYEWNLQAAIEGSTALVFTCSISDFFHVQADLWRPRAWDIMREYSHLTWLVLTKRPQKILEHLPSDWDEGRGYTNVWLGTTVGVRDSYKRMDILRNVSCNRRFLSIEPLLEDLYDIDLRGIDWILVGGMSGSLWVDKGMEMAWAASLYDKAQAAGIPYFWKQISAYRPEQGTNALALYLAKRDGIEVDPDAVDLIREFPETELPMIALDREKGKRLSANQLVSIGL
jgi:protein gp37